MADSPDWAVTIRWPSSWMPRYLLSRAGAAGGHRHIGRRLPSPQTPCFKVFTPWLNMPPMDVSRSRDWWQVRICTSVCLLMNSSANRRYGVIKAGAIECLRLWPPGDA